MAANTTLTFQSTTFNVVARDGQPWLKAADIARALGYSRADKVTQIYDRNAGEFTDSMSQNLALRVRDSDGIERPREVRIFSLRGAHLLAMFARTALAAAFRRWVLDVLEQHTAVPPQPTATPALGMQRFVVFMAPGQVPSYAPITLDALVYEPGNTDRLRHLLLESLPLAQVPEALALLTQRVAQQLGQQPALALPRLGDADPWPWSVRRMA